MFFTSIEFITYEPSNKFYTYNAIVIEVQDNGEIKTSVDIASIDMTKYSHWYDWIRMIFELGYMIIIFYMIFLFISRKIIIVELYNRWYNNEINYLSQAEKDQRAKYEPEFIRKFKATIDFFTIFEFLFLVFSLVIFIMWLVYITNAQKLKGEYSASDHYKMYNDFYNTKELFEEYKIMLALASICIAFNLLSHIFFLNHYLADSKKDIIYFFVFYIILTLGFIAVAHIQFGPYLTEYHTFGNSTVE